MTKRKRDAVQSTSQAKAAKLAKKAEATAAGDSQAGTEPFAIQIITGSYDRVLHGITAFVDPEGSVKYSDAFLFNAHTSAIRCLALSPPSAPVPGQAQKVMLATGSTDERINVYNLSAHTPSKKSQEQELLSSIAPRPIAESSKNRELGTLLHHSSTITKLVFPTRSKLLSSSEDSTIAVTRTRDWSLLSTIKAPKPKVFGRPSGDTAPLGGTPTGINDFAIHPSMKLMLSVSKGERSMRLWNLVTGKKAGVLNFARSALQEIGEGRHSTGEGRKVAWGSSASDGDEYAVAFDRDVLVFGMDSKPRCRLMWDTRTKVHQVRYLKLEEGSDATILAVSTEDGRIMFYSTAPGDLINSVPHDPKETSILPRAQLRSQLGGQHAGVSGRVKDFIILNRPGDKGIWYIATGSSDGKVRLWKIDRASLELTGKAGSGKHVGQLLGTYETQNRITCLEAFVMIPRPEGVEDSDEEEEDEAEEESGEDDGED